MRPPTLPLVGLLGWLALSITIHPRPLAAQDWPGWRGPTHDGIAAAAADPPLHWDAERNVRWTAELPGDGVSTPIVVAGRIYATAVVATDEVDAEAPTNRAAAEDPERSAIPVQRLLLVAVDLDTGSELWQRELGRGTPSGACHEAGSFAAASPVTDGERIVASFGSLGVFCVDLEGEPVWSVDLGTMKPFEPFGEGASPALHDGVVVVPWDHQGGSFVVALDAGSGEELWRRPRTTDATWGTPRVAQVDGRAQVLLTGTGSTVAYDLRTGEQVWTCEGMTANPVTGPLVADGIAVVANSFRGNIVQAIRLAEASGTVDSAGNGLLWQDTGPAPYVPMPVAVPDGDGGGSVYLLRNSTGVVRCLDLATGDTVWSGERLGIKRLHASPVVAAGRIYFVGREGETVVLRAGRTFEVLARNRLDDTFDASPVVVGDALLLRGRDRLHCLAATR